MTCHIPYLAVSNYLPMMKYVKYIEQIQCRFTKLINGMMGLNYEQRLKELNLHTLAFRRKREQLIQVYKLQHNHYDAITVTCSTKLTVMLQEEVENYQNTSLTQITIFFSSRYTCLKPVTK